MSPWYSPWLALLASFVVAGIGLIGVRLNNAAADRRAREEWRREALLELVTEILGEAARLDRECSRLRSIDASLLRHGKKVSANHGKFADESDLLLVGLEESRFRSLIDRVLILADQQIADRARDLFASIEPVELAAQQLRQGLIRYRSLQVGYRRNEGFTGAPRELDMISETAQEFVIVRYPAVSLLDSAGESEGKIVPLKQAFASAARATLGPSPD